MTACAKGPLSLFRRLLSTYREVVTKHDDSGVDVRSLAIRHLIRGHSGEALLCTECLDGPR